MKSVSIQVSVETTKELQVQLPSYRKDTIIDQYFAILEKDHVVEILKSKNSNHYFISSSSIEKAMNRTTEVSREEFMSKLDEVMAIVLSSAKMMKEDNQ